MHRPGTPGRPSRIPIDDPTGLAPTKPQTSLSTIETYVPHCEKIPSCCPVHPGMPTNRFFLMLARSLIELGSKAGSVSTSPLTRKPISLSLTVLPAIAMSCTGVPASSGFDTCSEFAWLLGGPVTGARNPLKEQSTTLPPLAKK